MTYDSIIINRGLMVPSPSNEEVKGIYWTTYDIPIHFYADRATEIIIQSRGYNEFWSASYESFPILALINNTIQI